MIELALWFGNFTKFNQNYTECLANDKFDKFYNRQKCVILADVM